MCGAEARFLHLGLTSSDLLDTTLAIQLERASDLILTQIDALLEALERRAFEHKNTPHDWPQPRHSRRAHHLRAQACRSLCRVQPRPATHGPRPLRDHDLRHVRAVGTFANIDPRVETMVAGRFGLRPEPVSTQVIPRDRHAAFIAALALLAASIERLATEIRHLQRSEVGEAEEPFAVGQKGSSAMPHKRNPVLSENLTGLARMVRAAVVPALENVALWHERDISHSSVERVLLPDACILTDFALIGWRGWSRARGLSRAYAAQSGRQPGPLQLAAGDAGADRDRTAAAARPTRSFSAMRWWLGGRAGRCWTCCARTRDYRPPRRGESSPPCSTSTTTSPMSTMCSSACSAAPRHRG